MKEMWDKRYKDPTFAYGLKPNVEFENFLSNMKPGKILLPGEGEGRNAVYAASKGWNVHAFDLSAEGRNKALKLANEHSVELNYSVADVQSYATETKFDVIALIYLHLPPDLRTFFHKKLSSFLNNDGIVFIQAFSKKQLGKSSGGPQMDALLYNIDDLKSEFSELEIIEAKYHTVMLDEGPFHQGEAENITFIGKLRS